MSRPGHRYTLRQLMVGIAIIGVALCFVGWLVRGPSLNDMALSLLFGHDTVYAPGFTESKWRGLRAGASTQRVESILGPPLRKHQDSKKIGVPATEQWDYTESPGSNSYWRRVVVFQGGNAVGFYGDFYVD